MPDSNSHGARKSLTVIASPDGVEHAQGRLQSGNPVADGAGGAMAGGRLGCGLVHPDGGVAALDGGWERGRRSKEPQHLASGIPPKSRRNRIRMTVEDTARRGADSIRVRGLTSAWDGVDRRQIRRWRRPFAALLFVSAASPRTPRPATHRTRLPGQAPRVPAPAASLPVARAARRVPRAPIPVAFALAVLAVLATAAPANTAQSATLVSNVGQARANQLGFSSFYIVQEFTTGANGSAGFTLSSVELRLSTTNSNETSNAAPVVKIYSGSARGTLVATLVGPSNALPRNTTANHTYTVPSGTTVTLADSTSYWVVGDQSVSSQHVRWESTAADGEDAASRSDWAINNNGGSTTSGTGTFDSYSVGAFQIRVNGDAGGGTPPNAAPTAADSEVSTLEDTDYVFGAGDFAFSDTDSGDALSSVKVTTLPARGFGALEFDGTALASGDLPKTVTKAELDGGKLVFSPVSGQFSDDYASFMFKVSDGDADSVAYAMTVDVDPDPAWSEMVGNLGEALDTNGYLVGAASGKIATQGFRTGGGTQEFKLRSVGIDLVTNGFSGSETLTLSIYSSNADGTANATVHTLTTPWTSGPDIPSVGAVYFTAPAAATLAANTDYHVVVHGSGDQENDVTLELTIANGQAGEPGWSIEDAYRRNGAITVAQSFRISIRGANPAPGAPTSLTATASGSTRIDLSWTAPASDGGSAITGYKIEISSDSGSTWNDLVADTASTTTSYAHAGLAGGTTRHYRVSAINADSTGGHSNVDDATTNAAPTVANAIPDQTATAGTAFTYQFPTNTFNDTDTGDTLSYMATKPDDSTLPTWLSFTAGTRTFAGTPTASDVETVAVKVTADDSNGGTVTDEFNIVVSAASTNTAPTTTGGTATTPEDTPYTFAAADFNFSDADTGDTLASVIITAGPTAGSLTVDGVEITAADRPKTVSKADIDAGKLKLVPPANASGPSRFNFKVNDGTDDSAQAEFRVTISAVNDPPTVDNAIPDQSATVGAAFSYQFPTNTFNDVDTGTTLSYTATKPDDTMLPTWLSFNATTRTFTGTPAASDVETVVVKVTATDTSSATVTDEFNIVVTAAAQPIALVSNVGQRVHNTTDSLGLSRNQEFTTGNNDAGYTLSSIELHLTSPNPSTPVSVPTVKLYSGSASGTLVATLTPQSPTVQARRNISFTTSESISLTKETSYWVVTPAGALPSLRLTTSTAEDATPAPGWSIADLTDGANVFSYMIRVNGHINSNNAAPTLANAIPDQTATAGTAFSYQFPTNTFNDTDTGDTLSYTATKPDDTMLPTWLSFDATMRTFTGTPAASDVETVVVKVTATDTSSATVSDEFNIVVSAAQPIALVSNVGQPLSNTEASLGVSRNQEFTTGNNDAGYTLSSIELLLSSGDPFAPEPVPTVKLYSGSASGTLVATLTPQAPTVHARRNISFTTSEDISLTKQTSYWVVTPDLAEPALHLTTSTAEDATPAPGWSIAEQTAGMTVFSYMIRVNGHINSNAPTAVPANWSLKPTDVAAGGKFRLLFLSSTTRTATAADIADYNTFVQNRAAAGHAGIQAYSAGLRAVGCTAAVDARDNTLTTYTSTDKGVPIYWLNGAKAADDYEDFYDGDWDDEANDKNESGTDGPDTSQLANHPWTGCNHNGTESFFGGASRALGSASVRVGRPNDSTTDNGPIGSASNSSRTQTRPMYGLSKVFQVNTSVVVDTTPPTLTSATVPAHGGSITLGFSEAVARTQAARPPVSAFTVTADGIAVTVGGINTIASKVDALVVTVSPVSIRLGQTVVVTYTDPTTGDDARAIQDLAGNDAASFSTGVPAAPAVTNSSTLAAVAPDAPTGLTATASGTDTIKLLWTAPVDNGGRVITGYKIEVSADSETTWNALVADTAGTATSYDHTGLAAGTTRHYRVSAINAKGTSLPSNVDDATAAATAVSAQVTTLVSNTSQADADTVETHTDTSRNQRFTTGLHAPGYLLDGIDLRVFARSGTITYESFLCTVGSDNYPLVPRDSLGTASSCESLTNPTSGNKHTPPSNTILAPNTTYTVIAAKTSGSDRVTVTTTLSDNEDETPSPGWSIGDEYDFWSGTNTEWRTTSGPGTRTRAVQLAVKGTTRTASTDATLSALALSPGTLNESFAPTTTNYTASVGTSVSRITVTPTVSSTGAVDFAGHVFGSATTIEYLDASDNALTDADTTSAETFEVDLVAGANVIKVKVTAEDGSTTKTYEMNVTKQIATTVPGAPTSLTATASGSTRIDLSWTAPASDGGSAITGYKIEISSDSGSTWNDLVADTASTTTSYAHAGLAGGTTRHYRVSAINADSTGGHSNVDDATTNAAPTVANAIPDQTATAGTAFTYQFPTNTFNDTDTGDTLSYMATKPDDSTLPTWLSFTAGTRTFAGTPTASDVETVAVKVTADDSNGGTVTDEFNIVVSAASTNTAPTTTGGTATTPEDTPYTFAAADFNFSDADTGDTLASVIITAGPTAGSLTVDGVEITAADRPKTVSKADIDAGKLKLVPPANASGPSRFNFKVNDGTDDSAQAEFRVTISAVNDPPTVDNAIPDQSATVGAAFSYQFPTNTFNDVDTGTTLSYTATKPDDTMLPTWLSFNATTRTFTGTPAASDVETVVVKVTATDTSSATVTDEFNIVVTAAAQPIALVSNVGQRVHNTTDSLGLSRNQEFTTGNNDDGYTLSSIELHLSSPNPSTPVSVPTVKLYSGSASGTLVATLTPQSPTVQARRNISFTTSESISLTKETSYWVVTPAGALPSLRLTTSTAEDATPAPGWSIADRTVGTITVSYMIRVNGHINSNNAAPTLANAIPDQTATAGTEFSYQFPTNTFNDTDTGDTLSYTATKPDDTMLPTWLSFDATMRTFTGTPAASDVETVVVKVTATDTSSATVSDEFNIVVSAAQPIALVSNVGQPLSNTEASLGVSRNQEFTTGNNDAGYTLSSIELLLSSGDPFAPEPVPTVKLYSGSASGTLVATLTPQSPTVHARRNISFTTSEDISLTKQTSYWVVTPDLAEPALHLTTSTAEDATPAPGWSIAEQTAGMTVFSYMIRVNGHINSNAPTAVPANWSLKPTDVAVGGKFRLLFLSSTTRTATAADIADYNTFVQNRAAAGHAGIQAYSAGLRAVGCTAAVDARDNTLTTYTSTDKGVPIYWLNGAKAADDYEDFYDGDWDDEANDKNESGTDGPDTSQLANHPWTGCNHNGTESFFGGASRALGSASVRVGRPNDSTTDNGPIGSASNSSRTQTRPMYGLSKVFQVNTSVVVDTTPPTLTSATVPAHGGSITLGFSEAVARTQAARPPVSAFTVTADGIAVTVGGINTIASKVDALVVTVSPVSIRLGQTVVVTYTDPTTGDDARAIQDLAGNDAASFSTGVPAAPAVTNSSTLAAVAPDAPTGLTATASGTDTIKLLWTAPVDNGGRVITGYKIEVSADSETTWNALVADTAGTATSYDHTGLAAGTTRHYRVSAINAKGTSLPSNVDDATAAATAVSAQVTTLVSNTSQADADTVETHTDTSRNQRFTTGLHAPGYLLDGIDLRVFARSGTITYESFLCTVGSDNYPLVPRDSLGTASSCESLTNPTSGNKHTPPSNTILAPNTTYTVIAAKTSGSDRVTVTTTLSDNEDETPSPGWSIGDEYDFWSGTNTEWRTTSGPGTRTRAVQLAVKGTTRTASTDATLSALALSPGTLNESFAPTTTNYTASVGTSVSRITVTPTVSSTGAVDFAGHVFGSATTIEYLDASDNALTDADTTSAETFEVDLVAGANVIKVKVTAEDGSTTKTYEMNVTKQIATTVPGAPTSLTATASGSTRIDLSWTAPASDGGSAITGYKIEVSTDSETTWNDLVANTGNANTTYAHSGLTAGTTRHYRVSAINAIGTSATTSNVDDATTDAAAVTAPGAPTGLTATASGTTQINLSWTAPASDGGSAITGYKIEVSPNGTSSWTNLVADTGNANTTYEHSGLAGGTTRHYRVSAINSNGTSLPSNVDDATTGTTVPGAPTSLSATSSGSTAINLSWTAPASDGGSAITGYKIEVSPNGTSSWTNLVADTGNANTTYEHSGLAAGATRHYRVSAINGNGTSLPSNVDDATTGATAPGAPTSLSATASGSATINLSWSAPASNGGAAITGYKIEVSSDSGSNWNDLVADTGNANTTYEHSGLAGGTTRHYRVSAINSNGASLPSNVDDATTGASVPGAPTSLSATASGSATINLSWSAPASNGGSAITGYKIEVSSDSGSNWNDLVADTGNANTTYPHSGLAAGATRHYRVSAINSNGTSLPSNVDDATAGASVPGAPTSLSATASGSSTIDLSWSAPASNGGSAVTGYKIEVSSDGGSSWSDLVADTGNANTTYAHSGLSAGTTRHYRVSAINSIGTGPSSNVDDATTGTTVPGAPTSLSATASGSTAINLSWSAPASTGGSAVTGYKIEVSPNGTSSWTNLVADTGNANTTYAHTGLADGATRHYRVSAINSNGTGTHSNVANATTGRTTITFDASSYTAEESGAPATVTVELSAVPLSAVTIPLVVTHRGGATTGDYEGLPSSVTFWTTGRSRTFTVTAIDDSNVDGGESVQIGFGTLPAGYAAGTHRTATVALVDDETELIVDFGTGAPSHPVYVRESDTDLHRFTFSLKTSRYSAPDGNPRQPVTIPLVVTHRGGATPDDYVGLPSSVTFAVGESVTDFSMRAIPDRKVEIGEGLRLDFGPLPAGVRKGAWGPYETIEFVDEAASVPGAPTSLSATASGSSTINLSWTAPSGNGGSAVTGYRIEVSSDGGSSWNDLVADTGNANTTYAHSGLAGGATRHYRVSAINSNGAGSPSNVADATTGASVPGAPTSLSATASGSSTIDLSWTAPSGNGGSAVTGYKIEVSSDGGSSWSDLVADTGNANTTYAHAGLAAGNTRHYRVSAINANGAGLPSNVANATTGQTTVTFNASSYTAEESGATAAVTVELGAVPSSAVTIPLVVTHRGGATTGDYEALPSSVTFWTTGRSRTFRVRAIDDSDVDGGESVRIGFGTLPAGYAAGTHRTATVALVDDETELIVDFGTGAPSHPIYVRESDTDLHRITVTLRTSRYSAPDGNPRQPVTIPLVVTHRGGATPDDYEGLPSSVTFALGESVTGFDVRAMPDRTSETGEGLRLDFGSLPSGVRKGSLGPYETIEFVDAAAAQANLSVAGSLLTLVYREALDGASKPLPRDFVVTAQTPGGARAMVAVRAVSVRGSDVLLDLDRPVTREEMVTLTYLTAAMHPIRDAAGRLAPLLASEPVRNDTGADGPLEEKVLADAAGLEAARDGAGTERLDLSSRNLTDLSALAGLTGVVELDLRDNAITDLGPLAGLTQLRVLNLRDNAITDLGPLAGLTGLQVLDLAGNRVRDLWPLAGLTALERLDLSANRVAEIATLAQLTGLRAVDLADNRVADLWPLAGLAALERLNLSGNRVAEIATLAQVTGLRVVDLADNRVADLWPLAGLAALERLNLSGNRIAEIATLAGLGGLQVLLLDHNQVADVVVLSQLTRLAHLGLSGNRIADIGLLAQLDGLRRLDLSGNAVADVSALRDVSGLVWLRLSGNPVSSAAPLVRLENLRWLWLDPGTAPRIEALAAPAGQGEARLWMWIERAPAQ